MAEKKKRRVLPRKSLGKEEGCCEEGACEADRNHCKRKESYGQAESQKGFKPWKKQKYSSWKMTASLQWT